MATTDNVCQRGDNGGKQIVEKTSEIDLENMFSIRFGPLGPMHVVAKRVPNWKKAPTVQERSANHTKKINMQRLITILMKNDEYIEPTLSALETGIVVLSGQSASEKDQVAWHSSYKRWRKIPKYWRTEFLTKLDFGLSEKELNHMEYRDAESINQMFEFFLQLVPDDWFPSVLLNKELCARVCYDRHSQVGNRSAGWKDLAVKDYKIDWLTGGVYTASLVKDRDDCFTIVHKPTGAEATVKGTLIEEGEAIEILQNWHDTEAEIVLPNGFRCKPAQRFPKGTGPWLYKLDDKATQLADLAERCKKDQRQHELVREKTEFKQGVAALGLSRELKKGDFKETMKRKRLVAKQAADATPDIKKKRSVSLKMSPPAPVPLPAPPLMTPALQDATSARGNAAQASATT